MGFLLTEDQEMIRKSARAFVQQHYPIGHLRRLRDEKNPLRYSRELWKEFCATGLPSVAIPEEFGGGGLGMAELGLVMEELGRTLAPTPILSTMVLSANALLRYARKPMKAEMLPGIVSGDRVIAFAHNEGSRFDPRGIATENTFDRDVANVFIKGAKSMVADGTGADGFVATSSTPTGLTLAVVPVNTVGVTVEPLRMVDSRNAARVDFRDVNLPLSAVIGDCATEEKIIGPILDRLFDVATAALAAEMLGGILQMFDTTLEYLKTRKQFGVVIGSFQALKHRAANMFCEIELTKSAVYDALRALDANRPDASAMVSAAKARANDTFLLVSAEAIQMHGGIGATDELDVGFYYKRARVAEMMFGDSAYHRDRFARLSGY